MKALVFDTEANNLVRLVTRAHCIVGIDELGNKYIATPDDIEDIVKDAGSWFNSADLYIGHNIFGYDFRMLKKLYGWERPKGSKAHDTWVMSDLFNPNREIPFNCPRWNVNPDTGEKHKIGTHSLCAWGYRVGRGKPDHYDWEHYTEAMLHRCNEDAEINVLVYKYLCREGGMPCLY